MPIETETRFSILTSAARARASERARQLGARPGPKSSKPECLVIGHAWSADEEQEGWLICVACEAVRKD